MAQPRGFLGWVFSIIQHMDYYTDLLESYALLKKRKFKLTLKEEGEPTNSVDDSALLSNVKVSAGEGRDNAGIINGVSLWSNGDTTKAPEIIGAFGKGFPVTITTNGGTSFRQGNKKADQVIAALRGDSTNNPADTIEQAPVNPNEALVPLAKELQEKLLSPFEGTSLESDLFPGLKQTGANPRNQKAINIALKRAFNRSQGLGIRGAAKDDATIVDRLLASTSLPTGKAEKGLSLAVKVLGGIEGIHSGKEFTPNDLRKISEGVKVTKGGVLFEDVYIDYRSDANIENDLFVNAVDQINSRIQEHNRTECSGFEDKSEAKRECTVAEISFPLQSGNRDTLDGSIRGLMIEEVSTLRAIQASITRETDSKKRESKEKEFGNLLTRALKRGTAEQVKNTFSEGLSLSARQILTEAEGGNAAIITDSAVKFFVDEAGLTEKEAYELVARTTSFDDQGSRALALLMFTSRGFESIYDGLDVVSAKVTGIENSELKGQKTDSQRIVTQSSFSKWNKKRESSMSPIENELEIASKLANDDRIGSSGLSKNTDKDGNVVLNIEYKALSSKKSRVKAGEGGNNRLSRILSDDTGHSKEVEFIRANEKRIDSCLSKSSDPSLRKVSIRSSVKSFQDSIGKTLRASTAAFFNSPILNSDGKKLLNTGEAFVEKWGSTVKVSLKNTERAKLAKQALSSPKPSSDQATALTKIAEDVERWEILGKLKESIDSSTNEIKGEGLHYLMYRLGLEGGSLDENFKDVQTYDDRKQSTGLINATTYGTIAMVTSGKAKITLKGQTAFFTKNDGTTLMRLSFEQGRAVATIGRDSLTLSESFGNSRYSDLSQIREFLTGTQKLLERILDGSTQ